MFKCGKANEIYAFVAGVAGAEASGHREIMMVLNTCLFLRTRGRIGARRYGEARVLARRRGERAPFDQGRAAMRVGANMLRPSHRHRICPRRPAPSTFNCPAWISLSGSLSPVQTSVSARTVDSTTTETS